MKTMTNRQIEIVCSDLEIRKDAALNNYLVQRIENRTAEAEQSIEKAIACHWAVQKLMQDWSNE
jgi:hypothetical protein